MQRAGRVEDDSTVTERFVAVLLIHEACQEGDGLVPRIRRDGERSGRWVGEPLTEPSGVAFDRGRKESRRQRRARQPSAQSDQNP